MFRLEPAELLLNIISKPDIIGTKGDRNCYKYFYINLVNMDLISNHRTYEDFKKQLTPMIKPLFDLLRDYCLSFGKNVIEDVRMHRVVFCKSMTFRFFADMEPQKDSILIKIRRDRKEPQKEIEIRTNQNLDEIKVLLLDAYNSIH